MINFEYVQPPLPRLTLMCPAVNDLAQLMREVYPGSHKLGSMVILATNAFGEAHQDERLVNQWLFARFADLPSIDRALHLGGVTDVHRPYGKVIATTAAGLADLDAQTITSDPRHAVNIAAALFWFIADRVAVISTRGAAAIILDAPEVRQ